MRNLAPEAKPSAPTNDMSAKMPPSPWLSARITKTQYFTEMVMISVQTISDSTPKPNSGVNDPPAACTTVCSVYSGLVPRSPNTIPKALRRTKAPDGVCARPGPPLSDIACFSSYGSPFQGGQCRMLCTRPRGRPWIAWAVAWAAIASCYIAASEP